MSNEVLRIVSFHPGAFSMPIVAGHSAADEVKLGQPGPAGASRALACRP